MPVGADGLPSMPVSDALRTGTLIRHAGAALATGLDPGSYVFVQNEQRRNIYRIPLH